MTLAAGGVGIIGKVSVVNHWTVTLTSSGGEIVPAQ